MTDLDPQPKVSVSSDCPEAACKPVAQRIEASRATLGEGMPIRRALPTRHRRMVGAWCFLDHFGPTSVASGKGMRVGPHPHTGLQTVTWLIEGEILHRDSLGTVQNIVPGELNVMTSGRAISHSEESPHERPPGLHGVQFWIALPEPARQGDPAFEHHARLPVIEHGGVRATVLIGEHSGKTSPAGVHSPLVGLDIGIPQRGAAGIPLRRDFEYAALVTLGEAVVAGESLAPGTLLYLGRGMEDVVVEAASPARLILVGGAPFEEEILMWWNFVGRSKDEIAAFCKDWNAGAEAFGEVTGYDGSRLVAPLPPWAA